MRMPAVRPFGFLVAACAWAMLASSPADAGRVPVRCGTVVDDVAILDRDLRCDGVGVVLRNPRSVLELNGHTIASERSCADGAAPSGVTIEHTADGAQILGPGLVRGFVNGITIDGAVRVQVREVRISDSCTLGMQAVGTDGIRVRDAIFHRNGGASDEGGALRVERSARFALEGSDVFTNASGGKGAAVDLRDCDRCRILGNRIVANAGPGLRLDPESRAAILERNVVLDQRGTDVVDGSDDGSYVFNLFERGDGLEPPGRWPTTSVQSGAGAGPVGCGTMHVVAAPQTTVTLECPAAGGVRGTRNGVVAYRLLNPFSLQPFPVPCDPVEVRAPTDTTGGAVRCTNPERLYPALLEITCCLM